MKYILSTLFFLVSLHGFSQTTHNVTVHVNQPPQCTVVSTEKNFEEPVLYPNPATRVLHLKNLASNSQVEIYDAMGRSVFTNFVESENTISINVEPFARGFYQVIIRDQRRNIQVKSILE